MLIKAKQIQPFSFGLLIINDTHKSGILSQDLVSQIYLGFALGNLPSPSVNLADPIYLGQWQIPLGFATWNLPLPPVNWVSQIYLGEFAIPLGKFGKILSIPIWVINHK
jgi:hypothetical protein